LDWKQLENIVASLFTMAGCSAETEKSVSGTRTTHDVDVYVQFKALGLDNIWICECKNWKHRVDKSVVLAFRQIVQDVGANKGLIISANGFQSGAIEAVRNTNIELLSLTELQSCIKQNVHSDKASSGKAQLAQVIGNIVAETDPKVIVRYLDSSHSERAEKAAIKRLLQVDKIGSVTVLARRCLDPYRMAIISACIKGLSKCEIAGRFFLALILYIDTRFYADKLRAISSSLVDENDYRARLDEIAEDSEKPEMEYSFRIAKKMPLHYCQLIDTEYEEIRNGIILGAYFSGVFYEKWLSADADIVSALDYAVSRFGDFTDIFVSIKNYKDYRKI